MGGRKVIARGGLFDCHEITTNQRAKERRGSMNNKRIAFVVTGVVIVAAVAVSAFFFANHNAKKTVTLTTTTTNSQGQEQTQTKTTEVTKATDIKSTLAAWKAAGLTVSDDQGASYQIIGASNGGKYNVGQINVELYEFSDNSKAEGAKSSYFTSDSDTVLVTGTLLVDIHSIDAAQIAPIKAVF